MKNELQAQARSIANEINVLERDPVQVNPEWNQGYLAGLNAAFMIVQGYTKS